MTADPGATHPVLELATFREIAHIAYDTAGLYLPDAKRSMVAARLARRLSRLAVGSFEDYLALISAPTSQERRRMAALLTTNISRFFRESHHFELLKSTILPDLLKKARQGERLRFWSAGCANGQEAYSLGITLLEMAPDASELDIRILASDLDPSVVRFAQLGTYHSAMMSGLSEDQIDSFFLHDSHSHTYSACAALRKMILFRELNLHEHWPMPGRFDAILCRNVVIYFDEVKQRDLWIRLHDKLNPNGWLLVGHSERVDAKLCDKFELLGPTSYRRRDLFCS